MPSRLSVKLCVYSPGRSVWVTLADVVEAVVAASRPAHADELARAQDRAVAGPCRPRRAPRPAPASLVTAATAAVAAVAALSFAVSRSCTVRRAGERGARQRRDPQRRQLGDRDRELEDRLDEGAVVPTGARASFEKLRRSTFVAGAHVHRQRRLGRRRPDLRAEVGAIDAERRGLDVEDVAVALREPPDECEVGLVLPRDALDHDRDVRGGRRLRHEAVARVPRDHLDEDQ